MSRIGVIDSGVGGMTILIDLLRVFPTNEYFYLGDSKNCPYGEKTDEQIKEYSYKLVDYLIKNKNIEILVIACN